MSYRSYDFINGVYWQDEDDIHKGFFYPNDYNHDSIALVFRSFDSDPLQEVFRGLGAYKDYHYLRDIIHWQLGKPELFKGVCFKDVNKNDSIDSVAFGLPEYVPESYDNISQYRNYNILQLEYTFPKNFELPRYLRRNPYHKDWNKINGNLLVPNNLYVCDNHDENHHYYFLPSGKRKKFKMYDGGFEQ